MESEFLFPDKRSDITIIIAKIIARLVDINNESSSKNSTSIKIERQKDININIKIALLIDEIAQIVNPYIAVRNGK